ncbi:hypothetical protein CCB80_11130 [Armatimonadetes bacterium Uphvl-Ar1]|nr:hypothetical protein CCB80_11130 [Armatimonadetes bacterium Uphvl-Ar1]
MFEQKSELELELEKELESFDLNNHKVFIIVNAMIRAIVWGLTASMMIFMGSLEMVGLFALFSAVGWPIGLLYDQSIKSTMVNVAIVSPTAFALSLATGIQHPAITFIAFLGIVSFGMICTTRFFKFKGGFSWKQANFYGMKIFQHHLGDWIAR